MARDAGQAPLRALDPLRLRRLLLAPLGVERDRLRRARLPPRLQEPGARPARGVGGPRAGRRRPRAVGRAGGPGTGRPSAPRAPAARALSRRRHRLVSGVRARNESAWLLPNDGSRTNRRLVERMRRFRTDEEVDLVVVGCGAGGGVLTQRLARRGWKVVCFDAGPFWDPDRDWVSDEAGSHHLYWTEPRVISGSDPVPLGSNNSGRGVGGSMVHFAGYVPRFHPSDFATQSLDGVGADWPISYADLRPYYEQPEEELPAAGQRWPWGKPHSYPHSPHPLGVDGELFLLGCQRLGIDARVGPVAITNGRFGNRPHCIYRGFCLQGCKDNAKASPLIT